MIRENRPTEVVATLQCGAKSALAALDADCTQIAYSKQDISICVQRELVEKSSNVAFLPTIATTSTLFFFAGEPSGDLLGAPLINSSYSCVGVGGPAMQEAGLKPLFDFEAFQVMGFSSVIPALPRILILLHRIKRWIVRHNPQGVVLIDYAEFNLLLAKKLRQAGYRGKIIQYVCPSIWAWRRKRKRVLEEHVDHLLVLLPFEKRLFERLPVSYVGHPLREVLARHRYSKRFEGIALFPGSRMEEVRENLPIQLEAARRLKEPLYVSVAHPKLLPLIERLAPDCTLVPASERYDLMRSAKGALATCGSVILELGFHQTATVVTYKLSPLHYFLARRIFKIRLPYYSLVNLIADRELYPEFIHKRLDPAEIAEALERVMAAPPPITLCEEATLNPREVLFDVLSLP